ncbi:UDP-N-acetylmuramoyl-tripeptide--D-alanyl-D-alanine ligase [Chishuiella changwenlii]|uniref:Alanine racemase n=1 Tax=Chishuiella changwenlii TaxID=1434701 RepID=A0A1M6YSN4_9FLAO|nr:bifunctional UDP-N-acetylmuramoyl-tripeptide:D-alanyl-D-alanine ligase/alanine racemase [Chishuiella changwenlii]GGE88332.1 bifunctional UDP-N-acetylmuramoyl-tripeptide:D-alanyl-D-alanine ligase/alanine racemase [Chishuiella changwenlii]SHL21286.1 UDP-N-acetylmuramoyl-tripeptide--D-alanyl-D-alanine ligase [Chishuiella changwenlii]
MKNYKLNQISSIVNGTLFGDENVIINQIFFDSRMIVHPANGIFFALNGNQKDGHQYIEDAYQKGIRNFVVHEKLEHFANANFILVNNPLQALQNWAKYHRKQFNLPVIGITGSNGKTIVKEWLNQLLWKNFSIARSPKSYNSQFGAALSILQITEKNNLGIFEAGISLPNEMEKLEEIIQPTIGVLTKIGEAHLENFENQDELIQEKLKLFTHVEKLVFNIENEKVYQAILENEHLSKIDKFSYGYSDFATVKIEHIESSLTNTEISILHNQEKFTYSIPFTDDASIKNSLICLTTLIALNVDYKLIKEEFSLLLPIEMRLEIKEAINHSILINDTFNSDLNSLRIGLNVLNQQPKEKKSLVLTDILQSNLSDKDLYQEAANLVNAYHFDEIVLIGEKITLFKNLFQSYVRSYNSTEEFLEQFKHQNVDNEAILLKGARPFKLEKISSELETRSNDSVLEINLQNLVENINVYRSMLRPTTKLMCMVKANSYGTGSFEVAKTLQNNGVDFLGVAIADEGKELREAGITIPIIIMNPEQSSYSTVIDYQLEPEIYSLRVLKLFIQKLQEKQISSAYPIHLKLETGMNRLGFHEDDFDELVTILKNNSQVYVRSIFTHLATADMPEEEAYAKYQLNRFDKSYESITKALDITPIKHALNSPGIVAYKEHQYDMVRLGIGMYGYSEYTDFMEKYLKPVVRFKTVISQISELEAGETVSYGRRFTAERKTRIATLPVGYADGIRRSLGNGKASVGINGKLAKIVGSICMDMMMVDVTDISCKEGDEVTIFGNSPSIADVARWLETIPYEVLTSVSQRIKRVYYKE